MKDLGKTSFGIPANIEGLLCYLFWGVSGLIILIVDRKNTFVRFHAIQSVLFFGALALIVPLEIIVMPLTMHLGFLMPVFMMFNIVAGWLGLYCWIFLMVKAYQGDLFKLPILGSVAEKLA